MTTKYNYRDRLDISDQNLVGIEYDGCIGYYTEGRNVIKQHEIHVDMT